MWHMLPPTKHSFETSEKNEFFLQRQKIDLRKGNVLRKQLVYMGKKAASVLLKLFINWNEECHSTDAP